MLPEVDPLPGAEREATVSHGNVEAYRGERALDVRRHVIGPLVCMPEPRGVLGNELVEELLEILTRGGIGVLLDAEARGRVADENVTEPDVDAALLHDSRDLPRHVIEAAARSAHPNHLLVAHGILLAFIARSLEPSHHR